jgi:micrococcal nuclease
MVRSSRPTDGLRGGPLRAAVHRTLLVIGLAWAGSANATVWTAKVAYVYDGDTIRVESDGASTRVRLIGIDAPETYRHRQTVECFADEATERLRQLLPKGMEVRIESDPGQDERDRYGRLLGYVYRPGKEPPASVNYALVSTGFARDYVYDKRRPFSEAQRFASAERRAMRNGRGVWGASCFAG